MARRVQIGVDVDRRGISQQVEQGARDGAKRASPIRVDVAIPAAGGLKQFHAPLGRITGDLTNFEGALDASIARTLAFGASASVLAGVSAGMRKIVEAGIEVEDQLAQINSILNISSSQLAQFSSDLFDTARNTAQSFDVVSKAALELSRQGLSAEETLERLNNAMILSRLTGMGAEEAVSSLTAAINGFKKEGIDSSDVVNRLANLETKYAVSARDLAQAISRSGAVAQDAGVSFNELISIVTAVQQKTARGGNIIGNGFKSIFTRIQRSSVRETLEEIGVATSDQTGAFRGAIPILKDYAAIYDTLSDTERASTDEKLAGLFQINNLKAAIADLKDETSVYAGALQYANNTTDEAITRNEELNKTTAALLAQSGASLKEFAAALSSLAVEGGLRNVLGVVNTIAKKMADVLDEEKGNIIGKSIVGGIGNFISGPGLLMIGKTMFTLIRFLVGQISVALKEMQNLNFKKVNQRKIEEAIGQSLMQNENVVRQIVQAEGNRAKQEQLILNLIKEQQVQLQRAKTLSAAISRSAATGMFSVGIGGMTKINKAEGFVPNFAGGVQKSRATPREAVSEIMAASDAGYKAGKPFNTRIHHGDGKSSIATVNSAETIFTTIGQNGKRGTYVIPPTMAASGFVPNFAKYPVLPEFQKKLGMKEAHPNAIRQMKLDPEKVLDYKKRDITKINKRALIEITAHELGIGAIVGTDEQTKKTVTMGANQLRTGKEAIIKELMMAGYNKNAKIRVKDIPVASIMPKGMKKKEMEKTFTGDLERNFVPALKNYTKTIFSSLLGDSERPFVNALSNSSGKVFSTSTQGGIFESALKLASGKRGVFGADERAAFDFEETGPIRGNLRKQFFSGIRIRKADAKRSADRDSIATLITKTAADKSRSIALRAAIRRRALKSAALGFIPNFAANSADSFFSKRIRSQIAWIQGFVKRKGLPPEALADPMIMKKLGTIFAKKYGGQGFGPEQGFLGFASGVSPVSDTSIGPLGEAIGRERAAGVPAPSIRIQKSSKLKNAQNPHGLAVTNTSDEPRGLADVLGGGFVPNFAPTSMGAYNEVGKALKNFNINLPKEELNKLRGRIHKMIVSFDDYNKVTENVTRTRIKSILSEKMGIQVGRKLSASERNKTRVVESAIRAINNQTKTSDMASRWVQKMGKSMSMADKEIKKMASEVRFGSTRIGKMWKGAKKSMEGKGGMGMMGAYFAASSIASGMEQKGGGAGAVGGGLSSGLNIGYMASMIPGVGTAAAVTAGAIAGLTKTLYALNDQTEKYEKNVEKTEKRMSETNEWWDKYSGKLEEVQDAVKEGDANRVKELREELDKLAEVAPEGAEEILRLGENIEKAQKSFLKLQKENSIENAKEVARASLSGLDKGWVLSRAKDEEIGKAGKSVLSYLSLLGEDSEIKQYAGGRDLIDTESFRDNPGELVRHVEQTYSELRKLLPDFEDNFAEASQAGDSLFDKVSIINAIIGEAKDRIEKQNAREEGSSNEKEPKAKIDIDKEESRISKLEKSLSEGLSMFSRIIGSGITERVAISQKSGILTQSSLRNITEGIKFDEKSIERGNEQKIIEQRLGLLHRLYEQNGKLEDDQLKELKTLTQKAIELKKEQRNATLEFRLGRIRDEAQQRAADLLQASSSLLFASAEEIKTATQELSKNEKGRAGIQTVQKMSQMAATFGGESTYGNMANFGLRQIQFLQNSQDAAKMLLPNLLKGITEQRTVKWERGIMPKGEVLEEEEIGHWARTGRVKRERTETYQIGNEIANTIAKQGLFPQMVTDRNGDVRESTVAEKMAFQIKNLSEVLGTARGKANVSAKRVASGNFGLEDISVLSQYQAAVGMEGAAKTAMLEQRRMGALHLRASELQKSEDPIFNPGMTREDAFSRAEAEFGRVESIRDLIKASSGGGEFGEEVDSMLKNLGLDRGMNNGDILRALENMSPSKIADELAKFSEDESIRYLSSMAENLKVIREKLAGDKSQETGPKSAEEAIKGRDKAFDFNQTLNLNVSDASAVKDAVEEMWDDMLKKIEALKEDPTVYGLEPSPLRPLPVAGKRT